jgi:hypothetical protein
VSFRETSFSSLDNFFQGVSAQNDVGAVGVHNTVLEISTIHTDVHKVVVELQHPPELGILVHETSNLQGQVHMDGLLAHLQLKGLLVQLIASPKGRIHQMTTDLVLLAIQNISMGFLFDHSPPMRRIAFQFLQLYRHKLFNSSNIYATAPFNSPTIQCMGPFNTQSLIIVT